MSNTALAVHLNRLQLLADHYRLAYAHTPPEMKLAEEIRREIQAALDALRHAPRTDDPH